MFTYLRKLFTMFDRRQKMQFVGVGFLMLIVPILESASLGLFFPLLQALSSAEAEGGQKLPPIMSDAVKYLGKDFGENDTIIVFSLALFLFFVLKNAVIFIFSKFQIRFVLKKKVEFQKRLLSIYLGMPYDFHLHRNSAEIVRNITNSSANIFHRGILPLMNIAMESLMAGAIIVTLVIIDPVTTPIVFGFFVLVSSVFYVFSRHRVSALGRVEHENTANVFKAIQQAIGSIKETIVLGRESFFTRSFGELAQVVAQAQVGVAIQTQYAPRLLMEVVGVAMLCLVLVMFVLGGGTISEAIPILGVFAMAMFRLMPAANRVVSSLSTVRSSFFTIDDIAADYTTEPICPGPTRVPSAERPVRFSEEINLENVSYQYSGTSTPVLSNIDLRISKGKFIAFVGSSGAGKTTLADIILGLLSPTSGRMLVDGHDISHDTRYWQNHIGYVPQNIYLTDDSLTRNIALGLDDDDIDIDAVEQAVRLARLEEVVAGLPDGLSTLVGEHGVRLSGGQRQRIGIARALYHNPDVLIMDEATSALDSQTEHEITAAINSLKGDKTIIVIAHRLSTVRSCDELCFMEAGQILGTGTFDELKSVNKKFAHLVALADLGDAKTP